MEVKSTYKEEGVRRMLIRKDKRYQKMKAKKDNEAKFGCKVCGEYPYCYCGDGTPYSY